MAPWLSLRVLQAFIRAGIQSKQAISLAIYRKALRLSAAQLQALGSGKVLNLMSSDAQAVNSAWNYVNYAWATVIQVALCTYLLYSLLGPSAFVALAVLLCLIPIQARATSTPPPSESPPIPFGAQFFMSGYIGSLTKATLTFTDKRLRLVGELVGGMRLLKFFAWEESFVCVPGLGRGRLW